MIGRPAANEYGAHYQEYVDQAVGDDVLALLESQLDESAKFYGAISEEKSLYRYAPGKWSIREALAHVTDNERSFAYRALFFARGLKEPLPSFDQDAAAVGAESDRLAWRVHLAEFRDVRLATVSLFKNLPPAAWMRTGTASGNLFTVRALAFIIAGHAAHHIRLTRELYLSPR
jgi:hypothetical protein